MVGFSSSHDETLGERGFVRFVEAPIQHRIPVDLDVTGSGAKDKHRRPKVFIINYKYWPWLLLQTWDPQGFARNVFGRTGSSRPPGRLVGWVPPEDSARAALSAVGGDVEKAMRLVLEAGRRRRARDHRGITARRRAWTHSAIVLEKQRVAGHIRRHARQDPDTSGKTRDGIQLSQFLQRMT